MTSSGYFSLVREKFYLLAEDGEKEAYLLNGSRVPLKSRGLGGPLLMAGVGGCTHGRAGPGTPQAISFLTALSGNVCLKAMFASFGKTAPLMGGMIHTHEKKRNEKKNACIKLFFIVLFLIIENKFWKQSEYSRK